MSISAASKKNRFYQWMTEVDRILRGEATQPSDIQQADINVPVFIGQNPWLLFDSFFRQN